jgi:ribonuclease Z
LTPIELWNKVFVVVDCPHVDYIPSLVAATEFVPYQNVIVTPQSRTENDKKPTPCVMIHLVGERVLEDERYVKWMKSFGDRTQVTSSLLFSIVLSLTPCM